MSIKPGDTVHHRPSGEDWIVGAVYEDGRIIPLGWPCSTMLLSDCDITERCSEDESQQWIREMAAIDGSDPRATWAARQLSALRG